MKRRITPRILAMLLVLAMFMTMTALSEVAVVTDGLSEGDGAIAVAGEELELSDDIVDIDLEDALVDLDSVADALPADGMVASEALVTNAESDLLTLGVGEKCALDVKAIGGGRKVTFTSSNKKVATVSAKGVVKGVKKGSATITATIKGGETRTCEVQVVAAPKKVKLSRKSLTLTVSSTAVLAPSIPSGTHASFTWSSEDKRVATVSDAGVVTGKKEGSTTITVRTHNGLTAICKVTVKSNADGVETCRALLIGEVDFYPKCARNQADVTAMNRMLKSITGPAGGSYSIVTKYNRSARQIVNDIQKAFKGADDDDVSLFFIATHGDVDSNNEYAGALAMTSGEDLMLNVLASALQSVPGKVIVILESCGAGAAVYANSGNAVPNRRDLYEDYKRRAESFDTAVVKAFSNVDADAIQANIGDFRVRSKFYVLTASRYQELSWGWESGTPETSYNYFTKWLTEGIGTTGSMPADANRDRRTTLNELYRYISKVGDKIPLEVDGQIYYQHVQVYPANSNYVLFCR